MRDPELFDFTVRVYRIRLRSAAHNTHLGSECCFNYKYKISTIEKSYRKLPTYCNLCDASLKVMVKIDASGGNAILVFLTQKDCLYCKPTYSGTQAPINGKSQNYQGKE